MATSRTIAWVVGRNTPAAGPLLDVIVNSSGLTDFNPDLRDALRDKRSRHHNSSRVPAQCDHAALLHLSTCYVVGRRDGRVLEQLPKNYTPRGVPGFDAEKEWQSLEALIRDTEARAESPEIAEELRRAALEKEHAAKDLHGAALDNQIRKNRLRWFRQTLTKPAFGAPVSSAGLTPTRSRKAFRSRSSEASSMQIRAARSPSFARQSSNPRSKSRSSAGTRASTRPLRFPTCSAHFSVSFRRTKPSASI